LQQLFELKLINPAAEEAFFYSQVESGEMQLEFSFCWQERFFPTFVLLSSSLCHSLVRSVLFLPKQVHSG
jgi:hypothetical protein